MTETRKNAGGILWPTHKRKAAQRKKRLTSLKKGK